MLSEQLEPLPFDLWMRELGILADWCANAPDDADDRAVRRAFHLAMLSPPGIRRLTTPGTDLSELDTMLEKGHIRAAARAVIGAHASVELEHSPQSDAWTAIFNYVDDGRVRCQAPTAARAMIRAWAIFFMTL